MTALIVGESAIFTIFVVAYVLYMGKSLSGPTPAQVLKPILATICLLSSSFTIWRAEKLSKMTEWEALSFGWAPQSPCAVFLTNTAHEWKKDLSGRANRKHKPFGRRSILWWDFTQPTS
jgi:cytochrome c oxidase subunit 3/cytochrome o ubiquinol oxidase subunit 3